MIAEIELENYHIEEEIGQEDVTITYRGRRKTDNAVVAITTIAPQFAADKLFAQRFQEVARQTTKLEHPNIVRTYETFQEDGALYIVKELIEAQLLADVINVQGPFVPQRAVNIARQIASALDYAHQKSMMHGDLSANAIYVDHNDLVLVANFGQTQAMSKTSLAKQGYAVGSPEILAPERVRGQGPSRQSDLYSLGILCYQMLCGSPPFTGTPASVLHAQAYEQPQPLHVVNPGVSVPLSEAVGRMLSKGLELRYITGSEFVRALAVAAEGTAPVRRPKVARIQTDMGGESSSPFWRRPWVWALVAIPIILVLLAIGFLAVSGWAAFQPTVAGTSPEGGEPVSGIAPSATPEVAEIPASDVEAVNTSTATALPSPTSTTAPSPTPIPATPTATPTFVPIPTPGPPVVAEESPFTNLVLAHAKSDDNQPEKVGTSFAPGSSPIYLFFDYADIEPGTTWTHRWVWGDTELGVYDDVWPDNYFETGTAWVFYTPGGGYQPGPYQVTIEVEGRTVATATFVIEAGGL